MVNDPPNHEHLKLPDKLPDHLGPFDRIDYPDLSPPNPEDFAPSPRKPAGLLHRKASLFSVTPNVIMLTYALTATIAFHRMPWGNQLAADRMSIFEHHQWWRVVTALFVHADAGHFLANFSLIVVFGSLLREYYGKAFYPLLSIILGSVGMIITLALYQQPVRVIGASGMLYSMLCLWLMLYLYYERHKSIAQRILRVVGFSMMMLLPSTYSPDTSYLAHAVGGAVGIAAGVIYISRHLSTNGRGVANTVQ